MIRTFCFLALILFTLSAYAQDSTIQYRPVHVILKLAALSLLLDPDATIQGGLEVRTGLRSSVQAEVGFGHKGLSVVNDDKKKFADWSIWRVRSEWRHYTNRYRTNNRKDIRIRSPFPLGNYLAIEGFAKQIKASRYTYDGGIIIPDQQQAISRFLLGSHIKWGRQIAIPGESLTDLSRVLLDFYVGVGIRYGITYAPSSTACGCGIIDDRFRPGNRIQPSVALGMKIGFGL